MKWSLGLPKSLSINWLSYHTLVLDFDGVFTDNKLWINEDGIESVKCDRGDGLAFDLLRSFKKLNNWNLDIFILSKETNKVVTKRAKKLKITCFQSVDNKVLFLRKYMKNKFPKSDLPEKKLIYVGNDLNDLEAAIYSGLVIVPNDSHKLIQKEADIVSSKKGGDGFIRDIIERIIDIERIDKDILFKLLNFNDKN